MTTLNKELPSENEEVPEGTPSYADIGPAWEQVLHAYKLQYKNLGGLVAADFELSLKAIFLCAICILFFVGFVLIIWVVILAVAAYAMHIIGLHWLIMAACTIILNAAAFIMVKHIYTNTSQSIGMKTALDALFSKKNERCKGESNV